MHQATSTPSHIFTQQHFIKHRDFTLTFSETGNGQDFCGLAVYLTLRFILLLADNYNTTCLYKHNHLKQKNMIQCTLNYPQLRQHIHMQRCYHVTQNTSSWAQNMAPGCADFPLWYHEQYQQFFEQFEQAWVQTTQHIGQLQKVDIVLEHTSRNASNRLLHHIYEQFPLLPFCVQVKSVPSNSHNTTFTGDIILPWC